MEQLQAACELETDSNSKRFDQRPRNLIKYKRVEKTA